MHQFPSVFPDSSSFPSIGLSDNLQETPIIVMVKSMVSTKDVPQNQSNDPWENDGPWKLRSNVGPWIFIINHQLDD